MSIQDIPVSTEIQQRLSALPPEQIKWIFARLSCKTDKEAAKQIGKDNSTVSRWPNKSELDEIVKLLLINPIIAAMETLRLAAPDAANVLVNELKGKQKRLAANDVLDRAGVGRLTKVAPTNPTGEKEYQPFSLENLTDAELDRLGRLFAKIEK